MNVPRNVIIIWRHQVIVWTTAQDEKVNGSTCTPFQIVTSLGNPHYLL